MSPARNKPRARNGDPLTTREIEILALVAAGEPTAAIAGRLAISENTVNGHLTTTPAAPQRSSQPASGRRKKQQP